MARYFSKGKCLSNRDSAKYYQGRIDRHVTDISIGTHSHLHSPLQYNFYVFLNGKDIDDNVRRTVNRKSTLSCIGILPVSFAAWDVVPLEFVIQCPLYIGRYRYCSSALIRGKHSSDSMINSAGV